MIRRIAYVHAIAMAFMRAVESVNLVVQIERRWWLDRSELMAQILIHLKLLLLLKLILIGWDFIVPDIWIMKLAMKLIIIHITLINVQFRYIDIDAQKSPQANDLKTEGERKRTE